MTKPHILIIGAGKKLIDRARIMGVDVTLIEHPQRIDLGLVKNLSKVLLTDYERDANLLPLVQAMHVLTPFSAVLSMTETGLISAAKLSDALGLTTGADETAQLMKDKVQMRQKLSHIGGAVNWKIIKSTSDLRSFAETHGLPFILKPRDGSFSMNVRLIRNFSEIESISQDKFQPGLLAEEYLDGKEYSVESFSFSGKHVIFAITEKFVQINDPDFPFVEIGHAVPAVLNTSEQEAIKQSVTTLLDILGHRNGAAHTEIKVTSQGVRIIETHNRLGGDNIPELVRLATGIDFYHYIVGWAVGLINTPEEPPVAYGGAAIRYLCPKPGKVLSIIGLEEARFRRGVVDLHVPLTVGSNVLRIKSSGDRSSYVIASSNDAASALDICNEVAASLKIETDSH